KSGRGVGDHQGTPELPSPARPAGRRGRAGTDRKGAHMAFNPFHGFRKHSKVIFPILTIICMITFILSSGLGRGDFFTWLVDLVGAGGRKGDVVTTLYGKKVYDRQVNERAYLRQLANEFLEKARASGRQSLQAKAAADLQNLIGSSDLPPEVAAYRDALKAFF